MTKTAFRSALVAVVLAASSTTSDILFAQNIYGKATNKRYCAVRPVTVVGILRVPEINKAGVHSMGEDTVECVALAGQGSDTEATPRVDFPFRFGECGGQR